MNELYICVLQLEFLKENENWNFYSSFYDMQKLSTILVLFTTKWQGEKKKKKKIKKKIEKKKEKK